MRISPRFHVSHASGSGPESFERRTAIDPRVDHPQPRHVRRPLRLGVTLRALEHFFQQPGAAVRLVSQDTQSLVDPLATNQVGQRPHLSGADPRVSMNCSVAHCLALGCQLSAVGQRPADSRWPRADSPCHFFPPLPPCPRKLRVGANSPNLWPTMSSVTNTFRCSFPL
jgi:hypothetical protein